MMNRQTETHQSAPSTSREFRISRSSLKYYWLCALVLSFCYERPLLYLTPFDRTNPRLFDIVAMLGLFLFLPRFGRVRDIPKPIQIWGLLVVWFVFCAIFWSVIFLDWEQGRFSLFAAAKYLFSFLVIIMVGGVQLDEKRRRRILVLLTVSGVFVSAYCIPEFLYGSGEVVVKDGLVVNVGRGALVGPFGASYFQLAQSLALYAVAAVILLSSSKYNFARMIGPLILAFICWPLLFSGSRTGLGLFLISAGVLALIDPKVRWFLAVTGLIGLLAAYAFGSGVVDEIAANATTLYRLEGQGGANSISERLLIIFNFPIGSYVAGWLLPLFGAGFYVAPVEVAGVANYRIDYGVHSLYLFPFEQGGVVGLSLFLCFVVSAVSRLWGALRPPSSPESVFPRFVLAYLIASLVVGIGAHNFWQGFASGNFNTLFLVCLSIALKSGSSRNSNYLNYS